MSPSAFITVRTVKDGKRYVVRFRVGGGKTPLIHAGSFKTMKDARARRDFIIAELAAGRDPRQTLAALANPPARTRARDYTEPWLASRVDVDETTRTMYRSALRSRILPVFGDREPGSVTPLDAQEWVGELAGLTPKTVAAYMSVARLLFDYIGVDPNPFRAASVRLPKMEADEPDPPPADHVIAILERVPRRSVLPLITIEQGAFRVSEIATLTWGDVDEAGSRVRLPRRRAKRDRPRFVELPAWNTAAISLTCPLEDRTPERRVFVGFNDNLARRDMQRACIAARIPHYHPHDLRHRRISLWHGQGIPWKEIADRVGHVRASMTLDVYSHVMPLEEVPQETYERLLVRSR